VSYVDAGYAIGLVVLFVYALSLLARRRRLEAAAARLEAGRGTRREGDEGAGTAPGHQ
jgi:HAMP domain-containing protein